VALAIGRGDRRHHRERGRDSGDAKSACEAVTQRVDLFAHVAGVADDAARPVQHAFTLWREALEARAAQHQQHAHLFLDLLNPRRQGRLGDAAGLGGAAEVFLARQRQQEFELVDHKNLFLFIEL